MDELDTNMPEAAPEVPRRIEPVQGSAVLKLECDEAQVGSSAVGLIASDGPVDVSAAFVGAVVTSGDVRMAQAGTFDVVTQGDVKIEKGAAGVVLAAGEAEVEDGFAGITMSRTAKVKRSRVGLLLSMSTEVSEDSRVIMDAKSAAVFGLVFGLVMTAAFGALFGWGYYSFRRWRSTWPHMPKLPHIDWPDIDFRRH